MLLFFLTGFPSSRVQQLTFTYGDGTHVSVVCCGSPPRFPCVAFVPHLGLCQAGGVVKATF